MDDLDFIDGWQELCKRVSQWTSYDFPDVDAEEVESQLYVFLTERKLWTKDPESEGYARALQKRANVFAWGERKEHLILTSQYSYRVRDVSILLETLFDYRLWSDATVPDDAKSYENSAATDGIEMTADVSRAYDLLSDDYKQSIRSRYADNCRPDRGSPEYKRLSRAKSKLTSILNSYCGGSGRQSRRSLSNATANSIIRMERDGQG